MSDAVHRFLTVSEINQLADAAYDRSTSYDSMRDEVLVLVAADLGLRVSELVSLERGMFDLQNGEMMIPTRVQKDYPVEGVSPSAATLRIDQSSHFGTVRALRRWFSNDWWSEHCGDEDFLFPSRQSPQMSTRSVENVVKQLAETANIQPRRTDGQLAEPSEMHPHALRHSVANYMLQNTENRLIDVRNRLRHRSIQTTERVYEHFQRR